MSLNEGQMVTYAIDEVVNTVENLTPMAQRVNKYTPPAESMQRSNNTFWMPLEQQAETQEGWDLKDKETDVLELSVKGNMGAPDNDFFTLRADDMRDESSFRNRINASAKTLANNVERVLSRQAVEMASLVVTSPEKIGVTKGSGWDFVADAESLMFARELNRDAGLSYFFNAKDYKDAGYDW